MKYLLPVLLLAGCASGPFQKTDPTPPTAKYEFFTAAEYIGKNRYEIRSTGRQSSEDLRRYLYERAFNTCNAKSQGYDIVEDVRSVPAREFSLIGDIHYEGYRAVIQCSGDVDRELASKYSNPEMLD